MEEARARAGRPGPQLIVVTGVSGCGKTSVAREIARRRGLCFVEGDEFHSQAARQRMAGGLPLDDEWRAPWIEAIREHLRCLASENRHCVLAYSGLRRRYREPLRQIGYEVVFLLLDAKRDLILERLKRRKGHYMPPSLLDSQLATLEEPVDEPDVLRVDASPPLDEVVDEALALVDRWRLAPRGKVSGGNLPE